MIFSEKLNERSAIYNEVQEKGKRYRFALFFAKLLPVKLSSASSHSMKERNGTSL